LQDAEERAFGSAGAECSFNFKAAKGGSIKHQVRGTAGATWWAQVCKRADGAATTGGGIGAEAALRIDQVSEQGAGGGC
jgi:hypothetical protein